METKATTRLKVGETMYTPKTKEVNAETCNLKVCTNKKAKIKPDPNGKHKRNREGRRCNNTTTRPLATPSNKGT